MGAGMNSPAGAMTLEVVPFTPDHLEPLAEALLRVRVSDPTYPPQHDATPTVESFADWLMSEQVLGRWVAVADGMPVGHISITAAHPYLRNAFAVLDYPAAAVNGFCEVSKFFTDPVYQGLGVGSALFCPALAAGRAAGFHPALAVIDTSYAARTFYAAKGLREVGSFTGIHGLNYVFAEDIAS